MKRILQHIRIIEAGHILAWLGFLFYFLYPFLEYWDYNFGSMEFRLRQGKGYFAYNAMIAVTLCSFGALLGGYWWRIMAHLTPHRPIYRWSITCALCLLIIWQYSLFELLGMTDSMSPLSPTAYYITGGLIFTSGLLISWIFKKEGLKITCSKSKLSTWFAKPKVFNWVFFLLILITMLANNIVAISKTGLPWPNAISMFLGRAAFYISFTATLCLILEWLLRATPKGLKWSIWGMYGSILVCIAADTFTTNLGRPLLGYINGFTQMGTFAWRQELKGAGEDFHSLANMELWQAGLIVILFFVLTSLFTIFCYSLSSKFKWSFSLKQASFVAIAALALTIGEEAIGATWKKNEHRLTESRAVQIQLRALPLPKGAATYQVKFKIPTALGFQKEPLKTKPDIYFIMVESMRADALSEKITPFLEDLRKDCQVFEHTWAASNATHLSWFSIFYSQPAVHWGHTVEYQLANPKSKGSPTIKWLKEKGYNIEVRAVCDLAYKHFGETNFGEVGTLASITEQHLPGSRYHALPNLPEREKLAFKDTQDASIKNGKGGNFYYLALDAPHYNYYWGDEFTPPCEEYLEDINLPTNPSAKEIQLYKNRYLNACGWVDQQVQQFVTFLKEQKRFDDSIIVIVGDHGEEFMEHGNWFHCSNLFPQQTSVPIFIKWPVNTNPPAQLHASHLDIMPSILEHLGATEETLEKLAGKSLLHPRPDHTSIITTNYAGTNGQTMLWKNGDYEASFSWPHYWTGNLPNTLTLENISKNGCLISTTEPSKCLEQLSELFPDALERFFTEIKLSP